MRHGMIYARRSPRTPSDKRLLGLAGVAVSGSAASHLAMIPRSARRPHSTSTNLLRVHPMPLPERGVAPILDGKGRSKNPD